MSDDGSAGRRWVAALFAALAAFAMAALVSSQLSLMSVLDEERADDAARSVAESRFTGDLIERTVRSAVDPVLDDGAATFVAVSTSQDQHVRELIRASLVSAHHQVVDPDSPAPAGAVGQESVRSALTDAVTAAGAQAGVDVSTVTSRIDAPQALPDQVPSIGLRPLARDVRAIAAVVVLIGSIAAIAFHPRPGRGLAGLGWKFAIVFGVWFVALLVVGWIVDAISGTLFGELVQSIWSDAVPAMLLLCGAGLLLCAGLWFAGIALDGLSRPRPPARPVPTDPTDWA